MVTELIAFLILTIAVAAVAWVWPRLQRRPRRNVRVVRAAAGSRPMGLGPAGAPASVSSHEATRLRRELSERMNALRQARKPTAPAAWRAKSHDDDGPVIGFAETMIQEDTKG